MGRGAQNVVLFKFLYVHVLLKNGVYKKMLSYKVMNANSGSNLSSDCLLYFSGFVTFDCERSAIFTDLAEKWVIIIFNRQFHKKDNYKLKIIVK